MGVVQEWCKKNNCSYYVEWGCSYEESEQPYPCVSCELQGQSYDIQSIAEECPHVKDYKTGLKSNQPR